MKNIFIILLLSVFTSKYCLAQNFDVTTGASLTRQSGSILISSYPGSSQSFITEKMDVNETVAVPECGLSYYYPFYPEKGNFSVGGMAGFNLMLSYKKDEAVNQFGNSLGSKSSPLYAAYAIPLLVMFRGGCASFQDNDEGFGGGLGAGISFTGFSMPFEKGFMASPDICGELRWKKIGLRTEFMTKKFKSYYKTDQGSLPRMTTSFIYVSLLIGLQD